MKYRKKPVVIEAIQFIDGPDSIHKIDEFMGKINDLDFTGGKIKIAIETLEGVITASLGDYIIKGVNGEFYPCKPDIFEKTYEKVEDVQ